ncbi:MAG TPA: MFS transporter [Steroidobacteraceae bacterium]|nr:MFS transporter [Steroidobacteraceae bacterium]
MPLRQPAAARGRWLVLALVLAVFLVDGMDTQMIAVAVPALAREWHLSASAFALALALGHAGAAAGGTMGGVLGDRIGARGAVIACAILFGVLSLCMTVVHDLRLLELLRLVCGLGLGGAIAPALAMLTNFFSAQRRGLVISLAFLCSPFGISAAGLLAAYVMPVHGWRALFVIAGVTPLALAALLPLLIPAASAGDATRGGAGPGAGMSQRLARWWQSMNAPGSSVGPAAPIGLFIGIVFIYATMSLVLSWLPSLLTAHGMAMHDAGIAISVWSASGIVGVPTAGWAAGRWGARRVATVAAVSSIVCAAIIALGVSAQAGAPVAGVGFYAPLAVTGAMTNALIILMYALGAELFPAEVRSTGLGLASTSGRSGSIVMTYIGGRIMELISVPAFFAITAGLLLMACLGFNLGRFRRVKARIPPEALHS